MRTHTRPLLVAIKAAEAAARLQLESLGNPGPVYRKGQRDLVTKVDQASELAITEVLREAYPSYAILAEEGTTGGGDPNNRWIVDPLDGTTNYAHHLPLGCVSIALERDGRVELAVVYDPYRREIFTAERGAGAFLNDQRISVSTVSNLEEAIVATAVPYELDELETGLELISRVSRVAGAVRILGSAVLDAAYVAAGRFDGYWEHASVHPWDVAAGVLLIEEAGGKVSDRTGAQLKIDAGEIVASNRLIHDRLLDEVGTTKSPPGEISD